MSRVRLYIKHIEIVQSGYYWHFVAKRGLIGALEDKRLVTTCAWPIDLYLVMTLVRDERGKPVYWVVEAWDGVGRPRPLPVPIKKWREGVGERLHHANF